MGASITTAVHPQSTAEAHVSWGPAGSTARSAVTTAQHDEGAGPRQLPACHKESTQEHRRGCATWAPAPGTHRAPTRPWGPPAPAARCTHTRVARAGQVVGVHACCARGRPGRMAAAVRPVMRDACDDGVMGGRCMHRAAAAGGRGGAGGCWRAGLNEQPQPGPCSVHAAPWGTGAVHVRHTGRHARMWNGLRLRREAVRCGSCTGGHRTPPLLLADGRKGGGSCSSVCPAVL